MSTVALAYTRRSRLFCESATTIVLSGASATPRGLLKLARVPTPSAEPVGPAPASVARLHTVALAVVTSAAPPGAAHSPGQAHCCAGAAPPAHQLPGGHCAPAPSELPAAHAHPGAAAQGWQAPASPCPGASPNQPGGQACGRLVPAGQK